MPTSLRSLLATTLLAITVAAACAPERTPPLAARVDGHAIPLDVYEGRVSRALARYRANGDVVTPTLEAHVRRQVLVELIDEALLLADARARGIRVTPEEVDGARAAHAAAFPGPDAYASHLAALGYDAESLAAELERGLWIERLLADAGDAPEARHAARRDRLAALRADARIETFVATEVQ